MKFKYSGFGKTVGLITFSVLCLLVYSSSIGITMGQKKPTTLKLDVDGDDSRICDTQGKGDLNGSRFCALYRSYYSNLNSNNLNAAQTDRNEMIDIVRGQVDTYYKLRKDGRRTKIRWFQTVLDFLEIGGAGAVAIINGARAKTITGVAIGMLQGGRTTFNKNFEILQTQVLINKMNTNRAQILVEIYGNIDKPVRAAKPSNAYTWYAAKNDLRRYLFAGTFDNALDTLVEQTGADVANAERQLRRVEKRKIITEATPSSVAVSEKADAILVNIEEKLKGSNQDKESATNALRNILAELNNTPVFKTFLSGKGITAQSSGDAIIKAIDELRIENADDDDLSQKIEQIIVAKGEIR